MCEFIDPSGVASMSGAVFNLEETKVAELAMVPNVRGGKERKGEESRSARTVAVREERKVAGLASFLTSVIRFSRYGDWVQSR